MKRPKLSSLRALACAIALLKVCAYAQACGAHTLPHNAQCYSPCQERKSFRSSLFQKACQGRSVCDIRRVKPPSPAFACERYRSTAKALLEVRGKMLEVRNDFLTFAQIRYFCGSDRSKRQDEYFEKFEQSYKSIFLPLASSFLVSNR